MAPICPGRNVALCSELSSTILEDSGDGLPAPTDCDTLRFLHPLPSCQIRQGYWIGQAAPNRDSNAETSLLWSTGSDSCVCHNSHDARRRFDEDPGPLSFVACGDERTPPRIRDFRLQHKSEDNLADALRACANSQDGNWISADTTSRIATWKIGSEHSLNPVENAVSKIDILVFCNQRLQHHHSGSHEVNENI